MFNPDQREYRDLKSFEPKENYRVFGYASTFSKYELYTQDGITVYEQIARDAFKDADTSDCIALYNHEGKVFARQSNGTLTLGTDDYGLFVDIDLSKSQAAREMYEEIKNGLVLKMSFAFSIEEEEFSKETRTRHIKKIKKLFDVSFVSRPANSSTYVQARSEQAKRYFTGVVESVQEMQVLESLVNEYLEKRSAI